MSSSPWHTRSAGPVVAAILCAAASPAAAETAGGKAMECALATQVQHDRATEALGSPLRIRLDAGAGRLVLEAPPRSAALDGVESVELAWLGEQGRRAVAVVVGLRAPGRSPVHVLDLDFAEARLRYTAFGGEQEFEALPEPVEYRCKRID